MKDCAHNIATKRLHKTIRERNEVQSGWKSFKTPIAEGQRIQYNFVKPHTALEGQTTAEMAGVNVVNGQNKWMELLKKSLTEGNRPER
jgi:hypothetical protein